MQPPLFDTNVSPAGVGSLTTTVAASEGPAFVTVTLNAMFWPGETDDGASFVIVTSALCATVAVDVALLFPGTGSDVGELTDAVLLTDPVAPAPTMNVLVIVNVRVGLRARPVHGNGCVQAPLFETNVRPGGVGSETVIPDAAAGPLFVTTIVYVTLWPAVTVPGPVLVMERSACATTVVVADAVLLELIGSGVVAEVTWAVLVIVPGVTGALTTIVIGGEDVNGASGTPT